jgi:D-aminopeptidase
MAETVIDMIALQRALNLLPSRFKGPGGVAGVVKNGEIFARRPGASGISTAGCQ